MCGIVGIVHFGDLTEGGSAETRVRRMAEVGKHRGPDNTGFYFNQDVVFGHNRLAIIDLDVGSNQPMTSPCGNYTLIFNGEIYNYLEIKDKLLRESSFEFKSQSDTEVVLAAYMEWGASCVEHFNGMFAFAVYDQKEGRVDVFRDRLGIKPLYYHLAEHGVVFASEIRGVIASEMFKPALSVNGFEDYLRYSTVHSPNTILKDVYMLEAGTMLSITRSEVNKKRFWDLNSNYSKQSEGHSKDEIKRTIKDLFYKSVQRRLVADVPFGAFLSGGIDSSAVVGAMTEISDKPVSTFTISFAEEEFSEAKYARMIAEKFGTNHTNIQLNPNDFLEQIPTALAAMDHPSADGPNTYVVSQATKAANITMALSGLGGDEVFGGYDIFKRATSLNGKKWLFSFPPIIRRGMGNMLRRVKPSVSSDKISETLNQKYLELAYYFPINRQIMLENQLRDFLSSDISSSNSVFDFATEGIEYGTNGFNVPFLSKVSYLEMNTYMQNVLLRDVDQMSMAHALEVRVPFLDHELLEYVHGVEDAVKFPHSPKQLLIESLGELLPNEIVNRPKMGFVLPWKHWIRKELKDYCKERIDSLSERKPVNGQKLQAMWKEFLNGGKTGWAQIWSLVVLDNWLNANNVEY